MGTKIVDISELENPTLTLKVGELLSKPWNRELREEHMLQETISKLKGSPIGVTPSESAKVLDVEKQKKNEWTTEQLVGSFDL